MHEQFHDRDGADGRRGAAATMFLEHDDFYQGGGHQYIQLGPKLIDRPANCRTITKSIARSPGASVRSIRASI